MNDFKDAVARLSVLADINRVVPITVLPEFVSLTQDLRVVLAGVADAEREIAECNSHNKDCAEENETLRAEAEQAEEQIEKLQADVDRLRKCIRDQIIGWTEVLKLDCLPERERWGAADTLAAANRALKGGA